MADRLAEAQRFLEDSLETIEDEEAIRNIRNAQQLLQFEVEDRGAE